MKRQKQSKGIKEQVTLERENIAKIKELIDLLDKEIDDISKKLYEMKESLNIYYQNLLSKGGDPR